MCIFIATNMRRIFNILERRTMRIHILIYKRREISMGSAEGKG